MATAKMDKRNRVRTLTQEEILDLIETQKVEFKEFQNAVLKTNLEIYNELNSLRKRIRELEEASSSKAIEIKEVSFEKAKDMVENFLREHLKENESVYPSDVADELGLKYELVRKVFDMLIHEGKLKIKEEG